jgi:hypothetical protein
MTMKALVEKLPSDKFKRIAVVILYPSLKKSIVNRKVRLTATELLRSDSYVDMINQWTNK